MSKATHICIMQTRRSHISSLLKQMMDCLQASLTWHYALQALVPTRVFLTSGGCVAQAVQGRLDLHPEHKGEGLHHVFRRDLPDSRCTPFPSGYSSLPQRSLWLQCMSQSSCKGRSAVRLGVLNIVWGCERQEVSSFQPFLRHGLTCRDASTAGREGGDWGGEHGSQRGGLRNPL